MLLASLGVLPLSGCQAFAAAVGYGVIGSSGVVAGGSLLNGLSEGASGERAKPFEERPVGIKWALELKDAEMLRLAIFKDPNLHEFSGQDRWLVSACFDPSVGVKQEMREMIFNAIRRLPLERQAEILNHVDYSGRGALDLVIDEGSLKDLFLLLSFDHRLIDFSRAIFRLEDSRAWRSWVSTGMNETAYYCPPADIEQWWFDRDGYFKAIQTIRNTVKKREVLLKAKSQFEAQSANPTAEPKAYLSVEAYMKEQSLPQEEK